MKSKELLKLLTIEEKVRWTSGVNLWQFLGNERLGIEPLRCADGPHGVRTYNTTELESELIVEETLNPSTMFPIAAGASIDVSITLDKNAFSIYSVDFEDFRAVPGKYEILVGKNVRDIELVSSIDYFTEVPYRKPLDENQPITNFKLYKTDVYDYLIKKYGKLEWYDMEQPMKRILFRINRDFKLSDSEYTELKKKIYE